MYYVGILTIYANQIGKSNNNWSIESNWRVGEILSFLKYVHDIFEYFFRTITNLLKKHVTIILQSILVFSKAKDKYCLKKKQMSVQQFLRKYK